jgi:hypothetical protein
VEGVKLLARLFFFILAGDPTNGANLKHLNKKRVYMKKRFAFLALSLLMFGMAAADISTGVFPVKADEPQAGKWSEIPKETRGCIGIGGGERRKSEFHECFGVLSFCTGDRWIVKPC